MPTKGGRGKGKGTSTVRFIGADFNSFSLMKGMLTVPQIGSAIDPGYFVSTTGSASWANAYHTSVPPSGDNSQHCSLSTALSNAASGNTIYIRAGTYTERLAIQEKSYTSYVTYKRCPGDEMPVFDGTSITPFTYEDGVIWIENSNYVCIDGIKVIDAAKTGIAIFGELGSSGQNIKILNCETDTTGRSGIATWYAEDCLIQGNTIRNSNMPSGTDEILSICSGSTNIEVCYNELYAGDRTLGATGGEGLNIKDGCSYVYVHHNTVDMARPDEQESDRYAMGVDGWTSETHHIYFYKNIVKNGSWGIQFNSEEGGYTHHIYAYNNLISHIGHGSMQGGGIGFPSYGGTPGTCSYCYWWNNTIYDCYYAAYFNKNEVASPILVQNNIYRSSEGADVQWGESNPYQAQFTLDHNLLGTSDPKFVDPPTDFHIQSDSAARNAGTNAGDIPTFVTDDYDDVARPKGSAYDIGAYEYVE